MTFDLLGKRFNSADVKLAFDIVLAADVEYLDKFSSQKLKTATHGNIEIKIDDLPTVQIKTDGKTTREIETEISQHLSGAKLSDSTLVTSQIGKDTRNIKPFDGSEVQLTNLAAKSISIDITDPSVGVLVKFKFKGGNTVVSSESHTRLFVIAGLGLLAAGFFRFRKKRSPAI